MRITRSSDGTAGLVLSFDRAEGELLVQLLGETAEAMQPDAVAADDPVARRLFPDAYPADADAERGFRELTESTLREERIERAEQCTAEVAAARPRRRGLEVVLDADGAQRWMRALNDVRLALGTRLEITEDSDFDAESDLDPRDPQAGSRLAYIWLTALQDGLVHAVMGS